MGLRIGNNHEGSVPFTRSIVNQWTCTVVQEKCRKTPAFPILFLCVFESADPSGMPRHSLTREFNPSRVEASFSPQKTAKEMAVLDSQVALLMLASQCAI